MEIRKPSIADFTNAQHTHTNAASGGALSMGFTVSVISTNTNAVKDYLYVLTGNATITLTFPAAPSVGDKIAVKNKTTILTCVVARNGLNIEGLAEDYTIDSANWGGTFYYADATRGWIII